MVKLLSTLAMALPITFTPSSAESHAYTRDKTLRSAWIKVPADTGYHSLSSFREDQEIFEMWKSANLVPLTGCNCSTTGVPTGWWSLTPGSLSMGLLLFESPQSSMVMSLRLKTQSLSISVQEQLTPASCRWATNCANTIYIRLLFWP